MLDQNTTNIITTGITAVSTLIAATIGLYFSNKNTQNLEQRKLEEVRNEKRSQRLEEIYQNLVVINKMIEDLRYEIIHNSNTMPQEYLLKTIKNINDKFDRPLTLVALYHRNIYNTMMDYCNCSQNLWNACGNAWNQLHAKQPMDKKTKEDFDGKYKYYLSRYAEIQEALRDSMLLRELEKKRFFIKRGKSQESHESIEH